MKFIDKNNLRQTYSNFISKKINSKKLSYFMETLQNPLDSQKFQIKIL